MKLRVACVVVGFLSLVLSVAAQTPGSSSASAQVPPPLIQFSNVATDEGGNSVSGVVSITFSLYTTQQGGEALWTETQNNVQLDPTGHYSVQLGITKPSGVPTTLFTTGEARWLGVRIAEQAEQARLSLVSVPYALKAGDAQTIGGLPPSAFVMAAPANMAALSSTELASGQSAPPPAGGPVTGTGTLSFLPLWDSTSDIISSVLFQSGSGATAKIGVNTTKPTATLDIKGSSTVRGLLSLPATGVATATKGANSQPVDLAASVFNSGTSAAATQTFQWQAEPVNNNTSKPTASLNLLFGSGTGNPAETGLNIASNGLVTFATGQTFPGTGTITGVTTASGSGLTGGGTSGTLNLALTNTCSSGQVLTWSGSAWACTGLSGGGTITGVTAGTDLAGGGFSGNVTLNLDTTKVPQLATPNMFVGTQTVGSGDLTINTGNLDLPQTANTTSGVITLGGAPFISACCSATSFNTFVGKGAGNFNNQGGASGYDTAVGYQALTNNTGTTNTAVGTTALTTNTSGNSNTAVGTGSLQANTDGTSNTAVGASALQNNIHGLWNTAVGQGAGLSNTTGNSNTFVGLGADAGSQNLTNATAIGSAAIVGESNALVLGAPGVSVGINTATPAYSLDVHGTGNFTGAVTFSSTQTFPNTISGVTTPAGSGLTGGGTSGTLNLALTNTCSSGQVLTWSGTAWACTALSGGGTITGVTAGTDLTGGGGSGNVTLNLDTTKVPQLIANNSFTGNQGVTGNVTASGTVAGGVVNATTSFNLGGNTFAFSSVSSGNTFLGLFAGNSSTTGGGNTATGYQTFLSNTTGVDNTATGSYALFSNTTGNGNTANGIFALQYNTTGINNTASGIEALQSNSTGSSNTATGYQALAANTASDNTADGYQALHSNTTGQFNSASGYQALFSNTGDSSGNGFANTASGYQALYSNTIGNNNTASGYRALFSNTTNGGNTAVGYSALYSNTGGGNTAVGDNAIPNNTTGSSNSALGVGALSNNTTGSSNTALGLDALETNSTGSNNTAVGYFALSSNSGSNNTALGAGATVDINLTNATAIGANAFVSESNALVLGSIKSVSGAQSGVNVGIGTTAPSNVFTIAQNAGHAIADGWDTYSSRRWKTNIHTLHGALAKIEQLRGVSYDLKANGQHEVGVIAEEVGAVVPEVVSYEENGKDARGVDYSRLTALLIEATKEQQREFRKEQSDLAKALRQIKQQQSLLRAQAAAMRSLKAEVRQTRETLRKVKAQVAVTHPELMAAK